MTLRDVGNRLQAEFPGLGVVFEYRVEAWKHYPAGKANCLCQIYSHGYSHILCASLEDGIAKLKEAMQPKLDASTVEVPETHDPALDVAPPPFEEVTHPPTQEQIANADPNKTQEGF